MYIIIIIILLYNKIIYHYYFIIILFYIYISNLLYRMNFYILYAIIRKIFLL